MCSAAPCWRRRTLEQTEDRCRQSKSVAGVGHHSVIMPSPYLRVIQLAAEMIARFGAELGMSPSSRSTLSVDEALPTPDQGLESASMPSSKKRPIAADPIGEGIDYAKRVVARKIRPANSPAWRPSASSRI